MNGINNDKLDALILAASDFLIEQEAKSFRLRDTSDVVVPPMLDRRIYRKIRRHERRTKYATSIMVCKRIVAAFLIVCTVTFALSMSIEAVRNELWNTIIKWFDDYISVSYVTETEQPTEIKVKMEPGYLPENYEKVIKADSPLSYVIQYESDGIRKIIYRQELLGDDGSWINNKNADVSTVIINGKTATMISYDSDIVLKWFDGEYSYSLNSYDSDISIETLMLIAESLK